MNLFTSIQISIVFYQVYDVFVYEDRQKAAFKKRSKEITLTSAALTNQISLFKMGMI